MDFVASLALGVDGLTALPAGSAAAAWLVFAFGLGLVHAFDADHVAAVSVLATRRGGRRAGLRAGLRWSVGHGLVVLAAGIALFALGRSLPEDFVALAERSVGVVMVGLGVYVWVRLVRQRSHLHFHEHDGLLPHAHWHTHAGGRDHGKDHGERPRTASGGYAGVGDATDHQHDHGALMLGALHGLAGSAPILAVLPAAARSPGLGLAYLFVFAVGVALAMALVSGLLGHLVEKLSHSAQRAGLSAIRAISATASIALGAWISLAQV